MKKCWIAAGLAAAMMVTSLTGCGSSDGKKAVESAAVNVPTEPFGDTVKYALYGPTVHNVDGRLLFLF